MSNRRVIVAAPYAAGGSIPNNLRKVALVDHGVNVPPDALRQQDVILVATPADALPGYQIVASILYQQNQLVPHDLVKLAMTWSPRDISGVRLWLSAQAITGLADGAAIAQWDDLSGNGIHAVQAVALQQPTFKVAILNDQPIVRFDGGDRLDVAAGLAVDRQNVAILMVSKPVDNSVQGVYADLGKNITFLWQQNGMQFYDHNVVIYTGVYTPKGFAIQGIAARPTAITIHSNDTSEASTDVRTSSVYDTMWIGGWTVGTLGFNGDIAEVVVISNPVAADITRLVSYWWAKYNLVGQYTVQIIFDGDSLTSGTGSTDGQNYPFQTLSALNANAAVFCHHNDGTAGHEVSAMAASASANIDKRFKAGLNNIVVCWGGTNDLYFEASAETVYGRIVNYCQARRNAGFKAVVATILPRSNAGTPAGFNAARLTLNTSIRDNWATFADALADLAANATIGDAGDEQNIIYYTDLVHMTNAGYAIVAGIVKDAILTLL